MLAAGYDGIAVTVMRAPAPLATCRDHGFAAFRADLTDAKAPRVMYRVLGRNAASLT